MSDGPKNFEKHIKTQLLRLSHLLGYPTEPVALRDYIAALSVAQTYEGAQRVIDAIVQELLTRDCPTAAMIRAKAYEDRERQQRPAATVPRIHCPSCQDFGIVESMHVDDLASVASYCACPAGQEANRKGHRAGALGCHDGGSPCAECVNSARAKLRKKFPGGNPLPRIASKARIPRTPDNVYHGEF